MGDYKTIVKSRIDEIDVAKGIGILLVLLGHSITLIDNSVNTVILSFHMPLFFYLSGLVINANHSFFEYFCRRFKQIGSAFVTGVFLTFTTWCLIDVVLQKEKLNDGLHIERFIDNWFLVSMLASCLVAFLFIKGGDVISAFGGSFSLVAWMILDSGQTFPSKYIQQTALAIPFVIMGYYTFKTNIYKKIVSVFEKHEVLYLLSAVTLCALAHINGGVAMAANIYNNKALFVITSLLGIVLTLGVSRLLKRCKLLIFCGRNSMIIFITHFSVQKILNYILRRVGIFCFMDYPYYLFVFFTIVIVEIFVVIGINKYVPFLFGKTKVCYKVNEIV